MSHYVSDRAAAIVAELARRSPGNHAGSGTLGAWLESEIGDAIREERKACAKVCETEIADWIRAGGGREPTHSDTVYSQVSALRETLDKIRARGDA